MELETLKTHWQKQQKAMETPIYQDEQEIRKILTEKSGNGFFRILRQNMCFVAISGTFLMVILKYSSLYMSNIEFLIPFAVACMVFAISLVWNLYLFFLNQKIDYSASVSTIIRLTDKISISIKKELIFIFLMAFPILVLTITPLILMIFQETNFLTAFSQNFPLLIVIIVPSITFGLWIFKKNIGYLSRLKDEIESIEVEKNSSINIKNESVMKKSVFILEAAIGLVGLLATLFWGEKGMVVMILLAMIPFIQKRTIFTEAEKKLFYQKINTIAMVVFAVCLIALFVAKNQVLPISDIAIQDVWLYISIYIFLLAHGLVGCFLTKTK